jgi:hypothetical protein
MLVIIKLLLPLIVASISFLLYFSKSSAIDAAKETASLVDEFVDIANKKK